MVAMAKNRRKLCHSPVSPHSKLGSISVYTYRLFPIVLLAISFIPSMIMLSNNQCDLYIRDHRKMLDCSNLLIIKAKSKFVNKFKNALELEFFFLLS